MNTKLFLIAIGFIAMSCSSVRVAADYDTGATFGNYRTYAFYKPGIDKAKISDLDKRRILHAIDQALQKKGLTKSKDPDLLVSIFTKENKEVTVGGNGSMMMGWGWSPWCTYGQMGNTVSTTTQGSLYIDLVDAKTDQLVWQGLGEARLAPSEDVAKKEARIQRIVDEILTQFPPNSEQP